MKALVVTNSEQVDLNLDAKTEIAAKKEINEYLKDSGTTQCSVKLYDDNGNEILTSEGDSFIRKY
jgi:hypothetical protein